jgi:arylsulfatase A-like enzyme
VRIGGTSKLAPVAAAGVAVAAVMAGSIGGGSSAVAGTAPARPNIVVIQTDDQAVESMKVMDNTRAQLGARGATFTNHFVNWPVCCPSRATLLTGQYSQNHGVLGNTAPEGGFQAFDNSQTTAVWLQNRGYTTAHVGKFLNGYGSGAGADAVPQGWDEWYTGDGNVQTVYNYDLNENGTLVNYGATAADFKQDVLTNRAEQLISEYVNISPLYLQLDYTAPHSGGDGGATQPPDDDCNNSARPAPRHANALNSLVIPEPPSFNEANVSDKPEVIRNMPLIDQAAYDNLTRRYRCRLESILSVDEGVRDIVTALRAKGALDETYIIFTSDNGFFTGEHRVTNGKNRVYEPSVRVPLIVRGPGIDAGARVRDLTINADLAATVVDVSGATPSVAIDGRSLIPATRHPWVERGRELMLNTNQWEAIHTQRYVYAEYETGELELYDLRTDPNQLQSLHDDPAYNGLQARMAARLAALRTCAGASCRSAPALRAKLRKQRGNGGCTRRAKAGLRGGDLGNVRLAEFFKGSRLLKSDRSRPFSKRYGPRALGRNRALIRIQATLADGRRIGWERKLKVCR